MDRSCLLYTSFSLLCEYVIKLGGVVFGASYDENFDVRHTFAKKLEECEQFRGSKYVQSKIGDTYKQAKKFLEEGKIVLFSGTQCQIKGLNLYLIKKYVNLIDVYKRQGWHSNMWYENDRS